MDPGQIHCRFNFLSGIFNTSLCTITTLYLISRMSLGAGLGTALYTMLVALNQLSRTRSAAAAPKGARLIAKTAKPLRKYTSAAIDSPSDALWIAAVPKISVGI